MNSSGRGALRAPIVQIGPTQNEGARSAPLQLWMNL